MNEELTNPIDEPVVPTEEVNPQEEDINDESDDGEVVDDDSEEVEHDGHKYRVPKALKPALMMHSDYTKKTQDLAEERKALQAGEQTLKQHAETQRKPLVLSRYEHVRLLSPDALEAHANQPGHPAP